MGVERRSGTTFTTRRTGPWALLEKGARVARAEPAHVKMSTRLTSSRRAAPAPTRAHVRTKAIDLSARGYSSPPPERAVTSVVVFPC